MASNKSQTYKSLIAQRDQLDDRIAATQRSLATSIGTPFVTGFGGDFTAKDAAQFASAIKKLGCEKALARLQ